MIPLTNTEIAWAAMLAHRKEDRKMTFDEAVEEMKKLAGDSPWSLGYQVGSYLNGADIRCYIARPNVGLAPAAQTYQRAIDNMKKLIDGTPEQIDPPPQEGE